MAIALASPVTGATQTGLTSPTYTVAVDTAPTIQGKQWAVTALGGTQTGVSISGASTPFTVNFVRPAALKPASLPNVVTGLLGSVSRNVFKVITRKSVTVLSGQLPVVMLVETSASVPAGADAADPASVRAALSLHIGALWQQSDEWGDTLVTGIN